MVEEAGGENPAVPGESPPSQVPQLPGMSSSKWVGELVAASLLGVGSGNLTRWVLVLVPGDFLPSIVAPFNPINTHQTFNPVNQQIWLKHFLIDASNAMNPFSLNFIIGKQKPWHLDQIIHSHRYGLLTTFSFLDHFFLHPRCLPIRSFCPSNVQW